MDICNTLVKTYNTNILDNSNNKEKELWKIVSKDIKNKKYKSYKQVLSQLVYNHFNLQTNKPDKRYISGPIKCSYWKVKVLDEKKIEQQKWIYLFGEYHGYENNCSDNKTNKKDVTDIFNYFKDLFINTDVFIDFYLEIEGFNKNKYMHYHHTYTKDTYLTSLRKTFYDCIYPETRHQNKCKLTRMHYIDIRQTDINVNLLMYFTISYISTKYVEGFIDEKYIILFEIFSTYEKDNLILYMINLYKQMIKKQLDRSYIKKDINHFFEEKFNLHISENFDILKETSTYILKNKYKKNKGNMNKIWEICIVLASYIVDAYTLSRIFRKFSKKSLYKTDEPENPTNIVIYAGLYHINIYNKFLEKYGDQIETTKDLIVTSQNFPRCLDMKGITQPLFSVL